MANDYKAGTVTKDGKSELEYYKTPRNLQGQTLAVGTGSSATSVVTDALLVDMVAPATGCFIAIGETPIAYVNKGYWMPADVIVRFPWRNGDKVAAIVASGSTNLHIHPVQ